MAMAAISYRELRVVLHILAVSSTATQRRRIAWKLGVQRSNLRDNVMDVQQELATKSMALHNVHIMIADVEHGCAVSRIKIPMLLLQTALPLLIVPLLNLVGLTLPLLTLLIISCVLVR